MGDLTLKQIRRAKGISVKEMAEGIGVHFNTYNKWEDHPWEISIAFCYKICNFLEVPYEPTIFLQQN